MGFKVATSASGIARRYYWPWSANRDQVKIISKVGSDVQAEEARNKDYDDHDADNVENVHCTLRFRDRRKGRKGLRGLMYLPATVTDAYADAHA